MVAPIEPKQTRLYEGDMQPRPTHPKPREPTVSAAVDRSSAEAIRLFAMTQSTRTDGRAVPSVEHNDDILYAGMIGTSAATEAGALRGTGVHVTTIEHSPQQDHLLGFDLTTHAGALGFAKAIGLTGTRADTVANVIASAKSNQRDELAAIAKVWATAERGGTAPTRLVLSGHSGGDDVNDGGANGIAFKDVLTLARAMPKAARYVEDVQLSGCNTGVNLLASGEQQEWSAAFPSLQTMWGYQGSCLMAPADQMIAWEAATRGMHPTMALDARLLAANVHVYDRGHVEGAAIRMPAVELDAKLAEADKNFETWMRDTKADKHDEYNPMNGQSNMYRDYQAYRVAQARDDHAAGRATYTAKADRLLLRRYQDVVAHNFAKAYASDMARAGLVKTATRAEMLDEAHALFAGVPVGTNSDVDRARALYAALETFDPKESIPRDWWREP